MKTNMTIPWLLTLAACAAAPKPVIPHGVEVGHGSNVGGPSFDEVLRRSLQRVGTNALESAGPSDPLAEELEATIARERELVAAAEAEFADRGSISMELSSEIYDVRDERYSLVYQLLLEDPEGEMPPGLYRATGGRR